MKVEENFYLAQLFDLYKPLLTHAQTSILEDYLNNNLTVSEIAENNCISRQAVKDCVDKSLKKLETLESKLHFNEKIQSLQIQIEKLKKGDR